MPSGGKRPGAGRKKGSRSATTIAKEHAQAEYLRHEGLTAQRVLEEVARIAFLDARTFWDADGNLKPLHQLTPEQGAALAGFETLVKNTKAGDGITDTVHKIKLWDKPKALEQLMKHFGLLQERVDVTGGLTISWQDSTS